MRVREEQQKRENEKRTWEASDENKRQNEIGDGKSKGVRHLRGRILEKHKQKSARRNRME